MTSVRPPPEIDDPQIPIIPTVAADRCRVCGNPGLVPKAYGFDYELLTCRNTWHFGRCEDCGHLQLDPRPHDSALPRIYPPSYYSYDMKKSVGSFALWGKKQLDRMKFARFLKAMPKPPHAYIDIGCGDLKYLDFMCARGVPAEKIFGLELSDAVAAEGQRRGYQVFNESVESAVSVPDNSFDLATMFHVIEHVDDPARVLRKIASWLRPGGFLILETPNFDSLDAQIFGETYWGGYHYPRHWHIFTLNSLNRLLTANGFQVEAVRFQTGHAFWLYSFHHWIRYNRRWPNPRLARLFDPLKSLPMLLAATAFDLVRAKLGFRTSAMLIVAKALPRQ